MTTTKRSPKATTATIAAGQREKAPAHALLSNPPMTPSEAALAARFGGPAAPLADVCQTYFGLDYKAARERAAANRLPVTTFRLTDSQKAPLMVHITDLAAYIDATHAAARKEWEKSQA
jgi:hypothetical protein